MKTTLINQTLADYNKAVKQAYQSILKVAKQQISTIENDHFRYLFVAEWTCNTNAHTIHEVISPLLFIRLGNNKEGKYTLHYGIQYFRDAAQYSKITSLFVRSVYHYTSKLVSLINIEDSVQTDWCITECCELYEYVELRLKDHAYELLPYKPQSEKRKRIKAVA